MKKEKRTPVRYVIPIQSSCDVELACTGAFVDKAILMMNNQPISIIKPDYDTKTAKDTMELNFLGDKPFRAGLVNPGCATVALYTTRGDEIPSLMMCEVGITAFPEGADNLIEDVTIGTLAGTKKNRIIYYAGQAILAVVI